MKITKKKVINYSQFTTQKQLKAAFGEHSSSPFFISEKKDGTSMGR
jgi:hypothetical protein